MCAPGTTAQTFDLKKERARVPQTLAREVLFLPSKKKGQTVNEMAKLPDSDKPVKQKSAFIIRNTSATILKSLSPQAAHLWMTLRRLADTRTGELRFPSGPFIRCARIMAEAGMKSKNTFGRYLLELRKAGLAHVRQENAVCPLPNGRKHLIFQPSKYSVSENPRQDWVSCVSQYKKPHRHSGPCVSQPCVSQKLRSRKNWDANSYQTSPSQASLVGESISQNTPAEKSPAPSGASVSTPFDFHIARLDPDCKESFLAPDGTAVLIFEHGILEFHPGQPEPFWHPF